MNVSMRIRALLCIPLLAVPGRLAAEGPPGGGYRVLFDRAHGEVRSGEPWSIDDDEPRPQPEHPADAAAWRGPLSRLALRLYRTGRYECETVPPGDALTWLDRDNVRDLSLFDLLVICEPHVPFAREEAGAIRAFVESGRSLLLAGRSGEETVPAVEVLNRLLAVLLDDGTGGEIRLRPGHRSVARPFEREPDSPGDPVLDGPFGPLLGLPAGRPLEIAWRNLGRDARSGPAGGGGAPLYLVVRRGDGAIGVAPDAELLAADGTPDGSGAGTTFFLNLIALLLEDRYPAPPAGEMTIRKGPVVELVTNHGVTISFGMDRPCWGLLELETGGAPSVAFRSLRVDQSIRVRGLGPDREYRAWLRLYDGWGRGPLRIGPISFHTGPAWIPEFGDVTISEVFWGEDHPYIELFNTLDRPVDLAGWSIMDAETRWLLAGAVAPGAFHLLSSREGGGGSGDRLPEAIHLDPAGDFLILQDDDGNVISTANLGGGRWPAGGESASMERVDLKGPDEPGNWETALIRGAGFQGTPGAANSRKRIEVIAPVLDATLVPGGIHLSWETTGLDSAATVGLYRSEMSQGVAAPAEYLRINDSPIPARLGSYLDVEPPAGVTVQYLLGVSSPGRDERFSDPVLIRSTTPDLPMVVDVTMDQNYPNPFNPRTEIRYVIGEPEDDGIDFPLRASLLIFDIRGRQIRDLQERDVRPGEHVVQWNGRDDNGEPVSSGSYYYRLTITRPQSGEVLLQLSRKMVLMR